MAFMLGQPIVSVTAASVGDKSSSGDDSTMVTLRFTDGSLGTLHYLAKGQRCSRRNGLQCFATAAYWNWTTSALRGWGYPNFRRLRLWRQDKGHRAEFEAFIARIADGGPPLMDFNNLANSLELALVACNSFNDESNAL